MIFDQIGSDLSFIHPSDITKKEICLPASIPPSFRTRNIGRRYYLILRKRLQDEEAMKPEQLELNVDVQVYSGLTARAEVLKTSATTELSPQGPCEAETRKNSQSFDPTSYKNAMANVSQL